MGAMSTTNETRAFTCCLCEAMCGLSIEVRGDEVVSIRGDEKDPLSKGYICPKATALKELHEDPDRLRAPMRRLGDRWEEISWDTALALAAENLHTVQRKHGRNAVGAYIGNPTVHNLGAVLYGPLLLKALHTKNRFSATSVDQLPHMLAAYEMFGHQLMMPVPDIDRTQHLMIFGANPLASNGSIMSAPGVKKRLQAIQARGGKVVVVDPRRTETAELADEHVFIRPGTDALLLLAMIREVFERGALRLHHLGSLVRGVETLHAAVEPYTPERAAAATGVDARTIVRLTDELLAARTGAVYGRVGVCTQEFGGLTAYLLYALNIVAGCFDREGGLMFTTPALDLLDAPSAFGIGRGSYGRWKSRVRGLPEFGGELPVSTLAEEILTEGEGQIRAMVTIAGNPVLSTPNGGRLDEAFAGLDFMVSVDPFLNETTRHAHLILPPVSPLERDHYDVALAAFAVRNTAKYAPAVFTPPPGQKQDWEILGELVHRLEKLRHGRFHPRSLQAAGVARLGPRRMVDAALRLGPHGARPPRLGSGLTLKRLLAHPHGLDLGPLEPRLPDRLPPSHAHVQLAPRLLLDDLTRLEARHPAGQARSANGSLTLIGRRQLRSNNSWLHNAKNLMRGKDRCTLLMHPHDASRMGLGDGDRVRVRSRVGEVVVPVEVTDAMMRGVVSLPHGFGHDRPGVRLSVAGEQPGASINDLTDDQSVDLVSGTSVLSGVEVAVERVAREAAAE